MKYLQYFQLFEKSSLSKLGIPPEVMKIAQRDLALSSDFEYTKITTKKQLSDLKTRRIFVQIEIDTITFYLCENDEVSIDLFKLDVTSGWGGSYKKSKRKKITKSDFTALMSGKSLKYELHTDYSHIQQNRRSLDKINKEFDDFTLNFKIDFLKRFDSILKGIVKKDFKHAKDKVLDKLSRNKVEFEMLIKSLENPLTEGNGVSLLDEFLIKFEDKYSEFFGEHTDILELSKLFSREWVLTSFMLFIYTSRILTK